MPLRKSGVWFGIALATGACAGTSPGAKVPQPQGGSSPGAEAQHTTLVRLVYTRPAALGPTGRPAGFRVISNYQSSNVVSDYEGTWDDQTLTLWEQISFVIGSKNLVYVVDAAVPPGLPTSISASREGRLRQVPCTPAVTTMQVCYELEITRGH